jgi:hypothetical protein
MNKKFTFPILLLVAFFSRAQVTNENNPTTPSPNSKDGQNKFAIFGDAEMTFVANKDNVQFGDVNFKPIFLWKMSDQLFVEAEVEFETGGGSVDIGLEYANMCFIVNKYLTLHAGRFLPKFGAYRGRFGEGFLNRLATDPVGFGDGGIGAMNEVGIGAQGGFGIGDSKINYDFYLSNGPILLTDPEEAGQFEYEGYVGNNKFKAVGGRIGFLPLSNSSLELGYSFQHKSKTGDTGTPFEKVGLLMQAIDLNYWGHITALKSDVRVIGEWKYQKVDTATYFDATNTPFTFDNAPSAYYMEGTIRPSHLHSNIVRNLELAARYSKFKTPTGAPWGRGEEDQFAVSLDYWLKWNSLVKMTYQHQKGELNTFYAEVVFGF